MSAVTALRELLIGPPAGFLYHLILLLSIEAGLGMAVHYRRRSPEEPWVWRVLLAFGGLLFIRVVMINIALLVRPDTSLFTVLWPPLDRLCSTFSLLIIIWTFVLPPLPGTGRVRYWAMSGGAAVILSCALLTFWWFSTSMQIPDAHFVGSWPDRLWHIGQTVLLGAALGRLLRRRESPFLLVSLLTLFIGHLLHFLFPGSHPHVAAWVRLGELVAYPTLAVMVYYSISTQLQFTAQTCQRELQGVSQDALRRTQELIFLLDANRNANATLDLVTVLHKVVQSLVDAILAGYGIIALLEGEGEEEMRVVAGYDPLEQGVWQTSDVRFSLGQYPLIEHAVRRRRQVIVQDAEVSAQLIAIHALMGSVEIGPMMISPLVHRQEVMGVVLLSNANSQKPFTAEDGRFAEALAQQVAA
ncbi:MAG: GAF domain-containing protein, partial [Chloroflexota bacterium]|nr:GAF domain-containing protein [Chloroflexota bacterium]